MAKKLLNEATVRRFQSLANLKPINETYNEEKMEETVEAVEETIEEGEENLEEGVYEADEEPGDAPEAPEMPEDELEGEMGESMDVDLTEEEARMLIELGEKLAAAMGEGEEDMMDDAPEMNDAPEAPEAPEMPLEETLEGINYVPSQGEIVNEVARRVARRLAEAQKAEKKMNEALGRK